MKKRGGSVTDMTVWGEQAQVGRIRYREAIDKYDWTGKPCKREHGED